LSAFEQSDDSLCREVAEERKGAFPSPLVASDNRAGSGLPGGHAVREWRHLIYDEGLTIQTNLFGTTYYSLVGLHAFHVTVGLLALATGDFHVPRGCEQAARRTRRGLSMYWHFVDVVWVVVFIVVYIIGR
jgi:hypothetical protein